MNREAAAAAVLGALILAATVIVGLGALGSSRTTSGSGQTVALPYPEPGGTSGVLFELRTSEGTSVFGIKLRADKHYARIAIAAPSECILDTTDGKAEVSEDGTCAGLAAHGEVAGEGTTATGVRFVVVELPITPDCFDAVKIGDGWPADAVACDRPD